ncbi:MAG: hypothetical protein IPM57_03885 [Oligoflexia bacterium]|nr:hypothetical protein [Oligoflexia bacterium]
MKKVLFVLMFILGCTHISTNVQRFNRIGEYFDKTVFISPLGEGQAASIEFDTYKKLVEEELNKYGVYVSEKEQGSDWILKMSYGVSGSQTEVKSSPIYGQTGGGTTYSSGTINSFSGNSYNYSGSTYTAPTYGVVGSYKSSKMTYNRFLIVKIFENKNGSENDKLQSKKVIFEGSAKSTGENPYFEPVSKCLFAAIFKSFPGKSKETFTEEVSFPCN